MSALSGPVYGLRTFRVSGDGELLPVTFDSTSEWSDGSAVAHCVLAHVHPSETAPARSCRCGIYSWRDLQKLREEYVQSRSIVGVISLEGTTYVGDRGWRAQKARVVALWMRADGIPSGIQQSIVERCAEPVSVYGDIAEMMAAYPGLALWAAPQEPDRRARLRAAITWAASLVGLVALFTCHLWLPPSLMADDLRRTGVFMAERTWFFVAMILTATLPFAALSALKGRVAGGRVSNALVFRPLVLSIAMGALVSIAGVTAEWLSSGIWMSLAPTASLGGALLTVLLARAALRRPRGPVPRVSAFAIAAERLVRLMLPRQGMRDHPDADPLTVVSLAGSAQRTESLSPQVERFVHRLTNSVERVSTWAGRHPWCTRIALAIVIVIVAIYARYAG